MKKWIRIAGNAQNIKEGKNFHWRFFVDKQGLEIPIISWSVIGITTEQNMIPGTSFDKDVNGLSAWIDVYGTYTIEDNILKITL